MSGCAWAQPLHIPTLSTWQYSLMAIFAYDLEMKTVFNSSGGVVKLGSCRRVQLSLQKCWQSASGSGHFLYNRRRRRFGFCCSHQAAAIRSAALSRSWPVIRNREDGGKRLHLTFTSPCFIRREFPHPISVILLRNLCFAYAVSPLLSRSSL